MSIVRIFLLFFATDGCLALIMGVNNRLQDVNEVAALVTNRVSESRHVSTTAVAVTPNHVR